MIDIEKARKALKNFLNKQEDKNQKGFNLKVVHTYHVVGNATLLAKKLHLNKEDQQLAELIALLHDIGRFEELKQLKKFDSLNFNHAEHGVKMLFDNKWIREFIEDSSYDKIIKEAIQNHNKFQIEENLDSRSLLHAKIIRDADKLDNFRVKIEEPIEEIFPTVVNSEEDMENATISNKIYNTIKEKRCIDIKDRKTPLDYWVCVTAFIFDLNFKESLEIVKEKDYINQLLNRFSYKNQKTIKEIEEIRKIVNTFIEEGLN